MAARARSFAHLCLPPRLDAVPPLLLEDESEDVLGLVVQAMKVFPVNEEVLLHGCGALQVLLETGQAAGVFGDRAARGETSETQQWCLQ